MNTAPLSPAVAAVAATTVFDEMVEVNRDLIVTSRELDRARARHALGEVVLGMDALVRREARVSRQLAAMLRTASRGDPVLSRALAAEVSRVVRSDEDDIL